MNYNPSQIMKQGNFPSSSNYNYNQPTKNIDGNIVILGFFLFGIKEIFEYIFDFVLVLRV